MGYTPREWTELTELDWTLIRMYNYELYDMFDVLVKLGANPIRIKTSLAERGTTVGELVDLLNRLIANEGAAI